MPRPDQQGPVVFELVEGDEPGTAGTDGAGGHGGDGPGDADPGGAPGPRTPRLPRLSRRTWLVAVAAVAAVVLSLAAVDLVRDRLRAELMRTSSVGVASLADPPERLWTMRFDVPAPRAEEGFVDQELVTMGGLLVLPPASTQSFAQDVFTPPTDPVRIGFEDIVAVDPRSGEVAWRVPVDENPVCDPSGYDASVAVDALVCVHGPADAREVLTIAPDGSTRSRAADLADGEQVFPAPDGMLVRVGRVERAGDTATEAVCSLGVCTPSVLEKGRDVRVVAEDAATGAERWTSTVEFVPAESVNCPQVPGEDGETVVDADHVSVYSGAESVTVEGCGVSATLSVQGVRLDLAGPGDAGADDGASGSSVAWVNELGGGMFALATGSVRTFVVDGEGEPVRTLDGWVYAETWSPDAPHDLWFVVDPSDGRGFDAVREDGSVAWTDRNSQGILLVGRDVVVVDRGATVAGLDRDTGEEVWVWDGGDTEGMARYRTVTDGDTVAMVHLPQNGRPGAEVVALDLGTGEEQWDTPVPGSAVAVDGSLVAISRDGLTGLG
ncbi:PQQ-binding-like beta-propeller repeat protein [Promicromonospora sukumoe]|uniref:outer membrane protein assembly factor BamB family protein n=1 Tax=Promicromonospora sukumoe TaxID=88382 RepID=UPI003664D465